ncbi:MAG: DUF2141 domain-containing protein [Alphaproteobacteria bacterium]|nr:DUF2141 domain-containing protein [Alphaproteobacteria bacterium]
MRRALFAALVLPLLGLAPPVSRTGDDVVVVVKGVRNDKGHVRVDLCTRETFLKSDCPWSGSAPARVGVVTVRITGVSPGTYAVVAYHDENDNGHVDRNFLGIPTETVGFSRDAPVRFGPPSWDDAAFVVAPGGAQIELTLRSFL